MQSWRICHPEFLTWPSPHPRRTKTIVTLSGTPRRVWLGSSRLDSSRSTAQNDRLAAFQSDQDFQSSVLAKDLCTNIEARSFASTLRMTVVFISERVLQCTS